MTDSSAATAALGSAYQNADASALTKAVKITGNSLANSIVGGSKNDSLWGSYGNDTLYGGLGNDKLWGEAGKDVIYGFEDGDLLQITGDWSAKFTPSKNEIAFKVGATASAITLKEFDASTFNVNGDSYQISGSKLVKK